MCCVGGSALLVWRIYAMVILRTIGYAQHMPVAIGLAASSSICWICWSLLSYDKNENSLLFRVIPNGGSRKCRRSMFYFQIWFIISAMMEIFDFPPFFRVFDAHSLWHACTVPLGFYWYQFIEDDKEYCESHSNRKQKEV
jgi:post-GPI attachment to proteins factor 3